MRKLGHGHSVMFFAPPKVDWSIRTLTAKTDLNTPVTTVDILCWAIHETWEDIELRAHYWAQQGMNHKARYDAWSHFSKNEISSAQMLDAWLQPDSKSLVDLYAPRENENGPTVLSKLDAGIRQRCKDLGVLSLPSAQMDEEQEREVHREREREREVELPPKAKPAEHSLHLDVVSFVRTGVMPPLHSGSTFLPVFFIYNTPKEFCGHSRCRRLESVYLGNGRFLSDHQARVHSRHHRSIFTTRSVDSI